MTHITLGILSGAAWPFETRPLSAFSAQCFHLSALCGYRQFDGEILIMSGRGFLRYAYGDQHTFHGLELPGFPGNPARTAMLDPIVELVARKLARDIRILEVGTLMGSSAITMAQALDSHCARAGEIFCIDLWHSISGQVKVNGKMTPAEDSQFQIFYDMFLHNVRVSGFSDMITPLVGDSKRILPALREEYFDLIYIDGSHTYSSVLADLTNAQRLVTDGGFIVGDDLELQRSECDPIELIRQAESDDGYDPKTRTSYHPGVTLAVDNVFGQADPFIGMYAYERRGDKFIPTDLSLLPRRVPAFFPVAEAAIAGEQLGLSKVA